MNIPIEQILKVIPGTHGYKSEICRRLRIHVRQLDEYIKESQEIRDAIRDEEQVFIDEAKEQLRQKVLDGDVKAIDIALKAKATNEGYGNNSKVEVNTTSQQQIVVLHAAAQMPTKELWNQKAMRYAEQSTKKVDSIENDIKSLN